MTKFYFDKLEPLLRKNPETLIRCHYKIVSKSFIIAKKAGEIHEGNFNYLIRGHSKTTLTIFCSILTTYLPLVDMFTK